MRGDSGTVMKFRLIVKKLTQFLFISLVIVSSLLIGQTSQLIKTTESHQRYEINEWVSHHPDKAAIADLFVKLCLDSRLPIRKESQEMPLIKELMSLHDCGHAVNANQLVNHLQKSGTSLLAPAWPLSAFK